MSLRSTLDSAVSAGMTLALGELVVVGYDQGYSVDSPGAFFRVLAITAVGAIGVCLIAALAVTLARRPLGMSILQARVAGVGTGAACVILYMVDVVSGRGILASAPALLGIAWLALRASADDDCRRMEAIGRTLPLLFLYLVGLQQLRGTGLPGVRSFVVAAPLALGGSWLAFRIGAGHSMKLSYLAWSSLAVTLALAVSLGVEPDLTPSGRAIQIEVEEATPVILLSVDTLRRDALSLYGSETPTPAIDQLAADGIAFDRAYATAPWTYPSFAGMHTGLTPWANGVRELRDPIPLRLPTLASILGDHGYRTGTVNGNGFFSRTGGARAISNAYQGRACYPMEVRPATKTQTMLRDMYPRLVKQDASTAELGTYAETWAREHAEGPSLLWLHFYDPHHPFDLVSEFPPSFDPGESLRGVAGRRLHQQLHGGHRVPGLGRWAREVYNGEVRLVDQTIGAFLEQLRNEGLYDRSLIVFTSDHGEEFAEHNGFGHGHTLYDELMRVPLIVKLPHGTFARSRVDTLASTAAIVPTILDIVGIPFDAGDYTAKSLRPIWETPGQQGIGDPVFMTGVYTRGEKAEAVVWEHLKYIRWLNLDHEELFDLSTDPDERYNLAARMPEEVVIGRALLAQHAEEEAERGRRLGLQRPESRTLTPHEVELLRGLGYLQ